MKINLQPPRADRWWDWPAAILLIVAILLSATRLTSTHWAEDLHAIQTVSFLGVVAGLALGYSLFSTSIVRLFAFIYGAFTIVWQMGRLLGEDIPWLLRLDTMGNRIAEILSDIFLQKPVSDNLFFLYLMAILFWTLSIYAGYSLIRHGSAWRAVLPGGLAIMIIQTYDPGLAVRSWFLAGYILLSLMLVARMHYLGLHKRWKENGTFLPPFIGIDSLRLGLTVAAVVVLFAWTAPALASALPPAAQVWQRATGPWLIFRNRISNAFASLQASTGMVADFYGDTLNLGRGNPLTDSVVLTVQTPSQLRPGERLYWRTRIYDNYDGAWSSTLPVIQALSPDQFDLELPEYKGRNKIGFDIKTGFPIQSLFAPSEPIWVSRPVQVEYALNPDRTVDVGQIKSQRILNAGDIYHVDSLVTSVTVAQLREAGEDYPEWVTDRYLQLPASITPRTRQLAEQIVADQDNPYDAVQAVTDYLRENIAYSQTIPTPPADKEPIDWLLFDYRQGFCNYYASAEVILLRAVGIPARLAVGYAQGQRYTLDPADPSVHSGLIALVEIYQVRHRDLHAWPEVYFPGIGWVEFEPTVAQDPLVRPVGTTTSENSNLNRIFPQLDEPRELPPNRDLSSTPPPADTFGIEDIPIAVWYLLSAAILAGIIWLIRRIRRKRGSPPIPLQLEAGFARLGIQSPRILRRWARFASLSPLARFYLELNRALTRLGRAPAPTDTPRERGHNLKLLLPTAKTPIDSLIDEYQSDIYGNQPGDAEVARAAGLEIRRLSFRAILERILARFRRPDRPDWTRSAYPDS